MEYFIAALKKFAVLSGRASRKGYWMFTLFGIIFNFVFSLIDLIVLNVLKTSGILSFLFSLVIFIPSISISIRRLHDINKSGKWFFINFVPVIGPIWFIFLMIRAGDIDENQYGPVPVDGTSSSVSEEKNTSNLESVIHPNQEAMSAQPTMVAPTIQPANQQQFVQQPPVQQIETPAVPPADITQPIQEITLPPQEKNLSN